MVQLVKNQVQKLQFRRKVSPLRNFPNRFIKRVFFG